jgi:hypothetical protein
MWGPAATLAAAVVQDVLERPLGELVDARALAEAMRGARDADGERAEQ